MRPAVRIVYTDLDGTMVGPGGCFFRAVDRALTLEPARALVDLHAAGVTLVLVSGRTRPQLVEACRIFGADGYVGELGAVVGWDGGRVHEVLVGDTPAGLPGTPFEAITGSGVVERLLVRHQGFLEYHSPWHLDHEGDVMLRGHVDAAAVEAWLATQGCGWLQLLDNGVLPPPERPGSLRPEALPAHVYHLMPRGLSKGLAVRRDLGRRGLEPSRALAVGDSASDLSMAPYVGRLWLTANSGQDPRMASLVAAHPNVRVADEAVGIGWVQAVRDALGARAQ